MKISKILMILCSVILLSSFADDDYDEDDDDYKKDKHTKMHISRSLEHLDLNKNQYIKIKVILLAYKKDYKKFYKYKTSKEKHLQELMKNEIFDKVKYINIHNEINTYSLNIEANKFKQIHDILTKKQRRKFSYFLGE